MQAAIVREYGGPDVVELGAHPDPAVKKGQVLVRVRAASLNPIDSKLRSGSLRPFLRLDFPAVVGFDFAGDVAGVGEGVKQWSVGDRVYGRIDSYTGGTHAQLAAVGADVIDRMPDDLVFEEAAALPVTGMTAVQALRKAKLKAGDRLLVNGASGGVGSVGVQIGRAFGADVTGVCRAEDADLVTVLGASRILDYTKDELDRCEDRFDVILDTVFNHSIGYYTRLLAPGGTFITTDYSAMLTVRSLLSKIGLGPRVTFVISRADGATMRGLSDLVRSGELKAVIDSTYPLSQIAAAYQRLEERHTQGKVVIAMPE